VIDDVICLQHVAKLLTEELENVYNGEREATAALADWRTKHASKTNEHADLARAHAEITQTKEQLLSRNEELEAEFEGLRNSLDETETALAEATSKWMHLEHERSFFGNTAKKINRHAIASLKSGQLAGILVSSVNLALDDLANVKSEAIAAGLGSSFVPSGSVCSFLDAPEDPAEKGEVIWAEELIQMVCTEIDGLRRTIREREVTLGEKDREISSLESARREITEMRNETEAARDAFYEHKEAWERSITAELTAQVSALREQVGAFEDDNRKARRSVSELAMSKDEQEAALERLRLSAKSREMELEDQIKAITQKHQTESARIKADLVAAENTLQEQLTLLDKTRSSSLHASSLLEEHETELRSKERAISRLEETISELQGRLEESEQVAGRARALAREKADLEGQLRALTTEHDTLRSQFRGKVSDHEGLVSREQEKDVALETAASRYMQQQTLLDELYSRGEELAKHAQDSLLKMNQLRDGEDASGLDREAQIYRSELDANIDLNPALAELMFARFLMHKLEAQIFALKELDATKQADYRQAMEEMAGNRAEMDDLMDHQQGVTMKMKSLQDKSREIAESLKEKEIALQEANQMIDELESKLERTLHQLDLERKAATQTKLERDDLEMTLEAAQAEFDAEVERLTELSRGNDLEGSAAVSSAEVSMLKRKLDEKEKTIIDNIARLRESEDRNHELNNEINASEEKVAELRSMVENLKTKSNSHGLREQMIILENEKERADQDMIEMNEVMNRLEEDTRNPRLLSVRRAGQMQHLMYEIEDLENRPDLDMEDDMRLRRLHEELFNIFEDTLCYMKGGMIQLIPTEMKKVETTLNKCKDPRQCINIFKEAHLSCKKIIVSVAPSNTSMSNAHWSIPNMQALDQVPDNKYMELLKNIRNLLVAHDMMDVESRSKLSTFVEIMINLDWLVILGHKAMDVELARRNKAERRAYGGGGPSQRDTSDYGGSQRGGASGPGSDSGSVGSRGQMSFKRGVRGPGSYRGDDRY
jgi:chromosome segregation ATPase